MPKELCKDIIKSLENMIVLAKRLELPDPKACPMPNYAAVKKTLIAAGGKYKKCGFEFTTDARVVLARLIGGEAINDKKKFQQFYTPAGLAERVVDLADIYPHHLWLEPSAGQGAIANIAHVKSNHGTMIEIMPENCEELRKRGYEPENIIEGDFTNLSGFYKHRFDRIVANPPFTKNQDIIHMDHMWRCLRPGGRIVCITSKSWTFGSQKKQVKFRENLEKLKAKILDIPSGEFKESGTNIATVIVVLDKPS